MKTLQGDEIPFSRFKGKKVLIVNTASKCGYTYQYEALQTLHTQFAGDLVVLAFPSNNFLWQESASNKQIEQFCAVNFGVTFPVSEKVNVRGNRRAMLYQWLDDQTGKQPSWNFCKYLVNENGKVTHFFNQKVSPLDPQIIYEIKK